MTQRWGNWLLVSIYSLILVLFVTPIGIFVVHFLLVPLVMLFSKYRFRDTAIPFLVILALYSIINLSFGTLLFLVTLFLLIPTLIMGKLNRDKKHGSVVIFSGFILLLGQSLIILLILLAVYDFNLLHWVHDQLQAAMIEVNQLYKTILPQVNLSAELASLVEVIQIAMTSILLILCIYFSWITYVISLWFLRRQGEVLPGIAPIREWKLPRRLIWLNLIVILLGLFVDDRSSYLYALYVNLFLLLLITFWIQGIGYLFYFVHLRKWSRSIPVVAIIASVFSPILYLFSIVGLIDLLFPIRKRISS